VSVFFTLLTGQKNFLVGDCIIFVKPLLSRFVGFLAALNYGL